MALVERPTRGDLNMDTLEAIRTRRSVRRFTEQPVSEEEVRALLEAAMFAPSAGDQRDWHFVVLNDRALLARVPDVHPYAAMVPRAPLAILVCGDLTREAHQGYWVQDCAAASQNLLLAARAIGLGAVWLGVYPREDRVQGLRCLLGLPDFIVPLALVLVGYAAVAQSPADRFDATKVSWNGWTLSGPPRTR
jgi:nitroreductase